MQALKIVAAVVFLILAGSFIRRDLYEQYRCHLVTKEVRDDTEILGGMQAAQLISIRARENLARLGPCLEQNPWSVRLHMLAAHNHALRDDHERAVREYEKALRYDRRPEIYFSLGTQLLHLGRTDEAIEHLVRAAVVLPESTSELPEPVRSQVDERVRQIRSLGRKFSTFHTLGSLLTGAMQPAP